MNVKKLFLLILCWIFTAGWALEKPIPFNTPDKKIIISKKNPVFTLTLPSNPTTGFSWKIRSYNKNLLTLIDHEFVAPKNKKLMGAPGYEVWTFKANKKHFAVNRVVHIVMEYRRPWTKEGATTQSFSLVMEVIDSARF